MLTAGALIMVIMAAVVNVYTLNPHTRNQCRDVQLAAITYLSVFTRLPLVHILIAFVRPASPQGESFGKGSMINKVAIVAVSSCMCITIAGFKAGTNWSPPRPITKPA